MNTSPFKKQQVGHKKRKVQPQVNIVRQPTFSPRVVKGEIKTVDIPLTISNFVTTPAGILLNGVATGTNFVNRIGAKAFMKSIQFKANIQNILTSTEGVLRMLVVYDKQPNGQLATIQDVIESRDSSNTATTSIYSCPKVENRDRFDIIRDKTWHAPACTNTGGVLTNLSYPSNDDEMEFSEFIKLKKKTTYKDTSAAISSIATGSLLLFLLCSGTTNAYSLNWSSRLRFYDN